MRIYNALGHRKFGDFTINPEDTIATIVPNAVTDEKLRDSAALSVIGRIANSVGDPADIVAANAGEFLRRYANAVTFGSTMEGNTTWDDNAEVQLGTDGDMRIFHTGIAAAIGNSTGPLGITALAGDLDLTASADVDILAGANVQISADFVDLVNDNEELRIGAGQDLRLFHNGANSILRNDTGTMNFLAGDNVAASYSTLGVWTFTDTPSVPDESWTYAKLQDVSAASRLLGRGDSGAGVVQEIVIGSGLTMTGTTLSASGGAGTVTSISQGFGIIATPNPITGAGSIEVDQAMVPTWTGPHTFAGNQNTLFTNSVSGAAVATFRTSSGSVRFQDSVNSNYEYGFQSTGGVFRLVDYSVVGGPLVRRTTTAAGVETIHSTNVSASAPALRIGDAGSTTAAYAMSILRAGSTAIGIRNSTNSVESFFQSGTTQGFVGTITNHPLEIYTNSTLKCAVTADGRLYGTALHNNAGAVTGATNQYIASGTYTPTLTNVANVTSSTPDVCNWIRVGNVVHVAGSLNVDPTAATTITRLAISLPIASALTATGDLAGTAASSPENDTAVLFPDTPNDRAEMQWNTLLATAYNMFFMFTYLVK